MFLDQNSVRLVFLAFLEDTSGAPTGCNSGPGISSVATQIRRKL